MVRSFLFVLLLQESHGLQFQLYATEAAHGALSLRTDHNAFTDMSILHAYQCAALCFLLQQGCIIRSFVYHRDQFEDAHVLVQVNFVCVRSIWTLYIERKELLFRRVAILVSRLSGCYLSAQRELWVIAAERFDPWVLLCHAPEDV